MKKFGDLSIQKQKMAIVSDAIEQIKIGKFIARNMCYLRLDKKDELYEDKDLKQILINGANCMCCAKGALFASCVIEVNNINIENDPYTQEGFISGKLSDWFSQQELDMIEIAFEKSVMNDIENYGEYIYSDDGWDETFVPNEEAQKAINFGEKFGNPKTRLLAILKNILEYGEFTP